MAIAENAAIELFGTKVNLASSSALVASGAFSIASDLVVFTNSDDAPEAALTLELTMAVAANDNSGCFLFFRARNVDGSNHDSIPEAEYQHTPISFFPVLNGITTIQRSTVRVTLPNYKSGSEYEVYIRNRTGQEIDAGWTVFVTPVTVGPHPA